MFVVIKNQPLTIITGLNYRIIIFRKVMHIFCDRRQSFVQDNINVSLKINKY